jgi:hypothetical protein
MADYSNIINEFKTVADAFSSVNYFKYNKVSEMNGTPQDKGYPLILVKSSPNTSRGNVNTLGLPINKKYTFDVFCYNLYNRAVQEVKDLQTAQSEVDLYLDQYVAKIFTRNIEGENGFFIVDKEQINGFLAHDVHNDKLVMSKYSVTVGLESSCDEGTFSF